MTNVAVGACTITAWYRNHLPIFEDVGSRDRSMVADDHRYISLRAQALAREGYHLILVTETGKPPRVWRRYRGRAVPVPLTPASGWPRE